MTQKNSTSSPIATDRAVYAISIAADMVSMQIQNLRVYERHGLVTPSRTSGGTRLYSRDDLARLSRVKDLLAEGLNLAGIARVMALEEDVADLRRDQHAPATPTRRRLTVGRGRSPGRIRQPTDTVAPARTSVPRMDRQVISSRVAASEPRFVEYVTAPEGAPNVVMVVLDDVGFAQLGCFGATIATPNIDRLAAQGLRYNRFHVTSVCSSTRAALHTGRNHHAVGMGVTEEAALGFPGYTGRIPKSAAMLARILRDGGYNTMSVGKWHMTPKTDYSSAGPFGQWPLGVGFERFYGFLGAETSQWAPELVRDNTHVDPPRTPEEGYHLTEDLVDESIRMIQDQQQAEARKPFFLHLATGAAHAPHQVTEEWVAPYRGAFDDGWEAWREQVFARQVAAGVVPADTVLTERPHWVPEWSGLPAEQRRLFARYMEVYAGFVTHTDHHLGRLFDAIEARGIADDTIVMVLSDNGASAEGGVSGTLNEAAGWLGHQEDVEASMERIDEIGGHDAYNHYPFGWAWAGNTPLRLWKRYAWLGGVRTPLVLSWGAKVADPGAVRGQFVHAVDLFSTILDAAGIDVPTAVDGVTQQPVDGTSMLPRSSARTEPTRRSTAACSTSR